MVRVTFAPNILKHATADPVLVNATTVGAALQQAFERYPALRGYVLEDQGGVRKHVTIFINARTINDRVTLNDPLSEDDELYVFQALSGG